MEASTAANFRDVLQNRQRFGDLVRFFIDKSANLHATESNDALFGRFLQAGLNLFVEENLALIFELTESPIETIFINSLLLTFIKSDPLALVIQHSVRNAPGQIDAFRKRRAQFKKFISWYKTKHGSLEGVETFLDAELAREKMGAAEHRYLRRHLVLYEYLALEDRFHLIIQPGIPDIHVEGRAVRPDLLIWVPSDASVRIIVECDGYEHHSSKVVFIHDRKRDRALKANGYEVLRYSGTEIYNDPVAVAVDLAEYLWALDQKSDA